MKSNEVNFILPNFCEFGRNEILIKIYEKYNFVFKDNVKIYSFYGTFNNAIWNGGRPFIDFKDENYKRMKKIRNFYNKKGIHMTFTFTNSILKDKHLSDEYCNSILHLFSNGMNEVLVNSKILENYIRQHYPIYKINKSITATEYSDYDTEKYYLSVLDKRKNKDFEYLNNIKEKERIELLCDETCVNNCPYTFKHYEEISKIQLGINENTPDYGRCRLNDLYSPFMLKHRNEKSLYYISPNDVFEKYYPLGFKFFKLSGRESFSLIGLESIIDYLIKDEYKEDVLTYILERTTLECEHRVIEVLRFGDKNSINILQNYRMGGDGING